MSGGKALTKAAHERAKVVIEAHAAKTQGNTSDSTKGLPDTELLGQKAVEPVVK